MYFKFLWAYCFFRPDAVLSFQLVAAIPAFYKKFGLISVMDVRIIYQALSLNDALLNLKAGIEG
jgi:hypothetical protein